MTTLVRSLLGFALIALVLGTRAAADTDPIHGSWFRQPLAPGGPPSPRWGTASTHDPTHQALLFTGGSTGQGYPAEIWGRDFALGSPWIPIESQALVPAPGAGGALAVVHPFRQLVLVPGETDEPPTREYWGGVIYVDPLQPAGRGPLTFWAASFPDSFAPRVRAALVAPANLGVAYLFGGGHPGVPASPASASFFNDLWRYDRREWAPALSIGTRPSPRWNSSFVYDPARRRLLLFGGDSRAGATPVVFGDTWAYSIVDRTWTRLDGAGPPRTQHASFYDPIRDRLVVFGGVDSTGATHSEAWAFDLAGATGWRLLSPAGSPPPPMSAVAGGYDFVSDRLLVFGGLEGETWFLDFGQTAAPQVACSAPSRVLPGDRLAVEAEVTNPLAIAISGVTRLTRSSQPNWSWDYFADIGPGQTRRLTFELAVGDTAAWPDSLEITHFFLGVPVSSTPCRLVVDVARLVVSASAEWSGAGVRLVWIADHPVMNSARVQRRADGDAWSDLGPVTVAGDVLGFADAGAEPGRAYEYRLAIAVDERTLYRGTVRLDPARLALAGLQPNPARAASAEISFSIPDARPALLEMFDVRGRRVLERDVGGVPGPQTLRVPSGTRAGIYFVRLTHGASQLVRRACLLD